ncbi:MAG: hypothetical protein ACRYGI_11285 [Janthinobacterium lividum]
MSGAARFGTIVLAVLALQGCRSIGSGAGAVVGVAAGAASINPLVGTAAGLGTKAAVDALVLYLARVQQEEQQDTIAMVAGHLKVGQAAEWRITHVLPFGDAHGTLRVAGLIPNPLADCREIVFTVVDGYRHADYVTTECAETGSGRWNWAQAEPATERWGFLQ